MALPFGLSIFSEGWKGLPNPARGEEMQLGLRVFKGEREYECDSISGAPPGSSLRKVHRTFPVVRIAICRWGG
jgi:hypothetical protein